MDSLPSNPRAETIEYLQTSLRADVLAAARHHRVSAGLVAAILADEIARHDGWDRLQERIARVIMRLSGWPRRMVVWFVEALSHEPLETQSFGLAQMNLGVLRELAQAGLVDIQDETLNTLLGILLDEHQSPWLVAARLRQTIDCWAAEGVDIADRVDILGTLYSMGVSGPRGIHAQPEPNARGMMIARLAGEFDDEGSTGAMS